MALSPWAALTYHSQNQDLALPAHFPLLDLSFFHGTNVLLNLIAFLFYMMFFLPLVLCVLEERTTSPTDQELVFFKFCSLTYTSNHLHVQDDENAAVLDRWISQLTNIGRTVFTTGQISENRHRDKGNEYSFFKGGGHAWSDLIGFHNFSKICSTLDTQKKKNIKHTYSYLKREALG